MGDLIELVIPMCGVWIMLNAWLEDRGALPPDPERRARRICTAKRVLRQAAAELAAEETRAPAGAGLVQGSLL